MNFKRALKAALFILLQALAAILLMSLVATPAWMIGCGTATAAFATLFLILFAGDEQSARLFFFEN